MKALDYTALIIVIIGAINWGLIGFLGFDLVALFKNCIWYRGDLRLVCHQFLRKTAQQLAKESVTSRSFSHR